MTVIQGEYTSFKHIKTRKAVVFEIEIPEEHFQEAINILGTPIGGESKPVGIALLDQAVVRENRATESEPPKNGQSTAGTSTALDLYTTNPPSSVHNLGYEKSTGHNLSPVEKPEGERMRIQACCLCEKEGHKNTPFFKYVNSFRRIPIEDIYTEKNYNEVLREFILDNCNISSRSELKTNVKAQKRFKNLCNKFADWSFQNNYSENLERPYV